MNITTRRPRILAAVLLSAVLAPRAQSAAAPAPAPAPIDIPFKKFTLKNGLRLIVHEDRKAPIVAVNIWYHVGSKNEKPGRTGFAHLFEHLMFNGSEHYNDDWFKAVGRMGATDLNGTTNFDRTNYFQNVPTNALDALLWLESDRMGHLLGAIDTPRLDEQRGVVQNEKRQVENQPYGRAFLTIFENTYPKGHPYSWSVIGSMEDLNAASLDDVKDWFKAYYGPNNAVIVVAGDIDAETARKKVEAAFGHIPAGPPITKYSSWVAKRSADTRQHMEDRVPQARLYQVWNVPESGSPELDMLNVAGRVLSSGKTSRLFKRLVYDEELATDVAADVIARQIGSYFYVTASARPGVELGKVEDAVNEELSRFLEKGPTPAELERIKAEHRANFIRGVERVGGFGGKSDILAQNEVYAGDPAYYKTTLKRVQGATAPAVQGAARLWLSNGRHTLEVRPFPALAAEKTGLDRSKRPPAGSPPAAKFPRFQRATLSNGLQVVLAESRAVPQVLARLVIDAGYAADAGGLPGTAGLALDMMDEGTTTRNALLISEELQRLGATLSAASDLDNSTVYLSALKEKLDPSLALFADVILRPSFPVGELERLRKRWLARIQQEKVEPQSMAQRVIPRLLYGEGHAYANPLTGTGTEASVAKITRETLVKFHRDWIKPNQATLIVVGDTTLAEMTPKLETLFAGWKPGPAPAKNLAAVTRPKEAAVYLLDRPGALQTMIVAGEVAPPRSDPDDIPIRTMNRVLGGDFTSRINMNLREDKHWSYGSRSSVLEARGQRPFLVTAPVQTDKTKESITELIKEFQGVLGAIPITAEELAKAKDTLTLTLPGQWETMGAVANSLAEIVRFSLPDDYFDHYAGRIHKLSLADLNRAAAAVVNPASLAWVIVGDRAKVEAGVRALNLGPVQLLDAEGLPVYAAP